MSTGELGGHNFLSPDLIKKLVTDVNGTIVECNTAYGGSRANTAMHMQVAKDHGFAAIAPIDIQDAEGSISLPVKNGKHLTENLVGSHFKGHAMGGLLSLAASSHPDGLEWSIERIAGSTELASSGIAYEVAEKIQGITALFPDYSFKSSESILGTSFSGIFGGMAVIVLCIVSCYLFNFFKGKSENE